MAAQKDLAIWNRRRDHIGRRSPKSFVYVILERIELLRQLALCHLLTASQIPQHGVPRLAHPLRNRAHASTKLDTSKNPVSAAVWFSDGVLHVERPRCYTAMRPAAVSCCFTLPLRHSPSARSCGAYCKEICHADFHSGSGEAYGADDERHRPFLPGKDVLDIGADFDLAALAFAMCDGFRIETLPGKMRFVFL